jgi:hypothetical protein
MGAARPALIGWAAAVALLAAAAGRPVGAQHPAEAREVRQLVTFRFLPGQLRVARDIYRRQLVPIYRDVETMRQVRVFGEAESPEPFDLMVVTHYADLAAMDRANKALEQPAPERPPVSFFYSQLANLCLGNHDQFVEVISPPATAAPDDTLEVLEFLRLEPGFAESFEQQMLASVHAWELEDEMRSVVLRSETARFFVADGWDYLRTYAIRSLSAWQAYTTARGRHPAAAAVNRMVAARKTMILREMQDLRVR